MSDGCGHRSGWDLYDGTCKGCGTAASTLYEELRGEAEGYKARIAELEERCAAEQLVINRAHKLILAAERQLSESGGLIPGMLKEYREALAALRESEG